jgi:hypothetical protein
MRALDLKPTRECDDETAEEAAVLRRGVFARKQVYSASGAIDDAAWKRRRS